MAKSSRHFDSTYAKMTITYIKVIPSILVSLSGDQRLHTQFASLNLEQAVAVRDALSEWIGQARVNDIEEV